MEATVLPDRVTIGPEFVPRRLDLPLKLVVPAGQTMLLADGAVLDYVEVSGTLTVSRLHNTTAKVTTLIVMPEGLLDFGSKASPIPDNIKVKISIRNVSIDFIKDPFQWGNGIVNFGDWTTFGTVKTPEVIIADVMAGATSLTLQSAPVGWKVGDELILPDTQTPLASGPRIESTVTIAALSGTSVTLSKPLDFDHKTVLGLDGRLGVHPVVLNITRNIVITSDDPVGTPGHVVNTADMSCWDIQNTAFVGLGRTKPIPLDSTSSVLDHIGTNQIGKYAFHAHHVHMPCTFPRQFVGNVLVGGGSGKWGMVTHGTSDTLIKDSIALKFVGAGWITEDGYEVRNRYEHCIAYACLNPANAGRSARENLELLQPGTEGTGFWCHGVANTFDHNEAWNCGVGMNLFDFRGKPGLYPSVPDGMPDVSFATPYTNDGPPLLFDHMLCVANTTIGLEVWGLKDIGLTLRLDLLPVLDHYIGVNNYDGVLVQQSEAFSTAYFKSPTIIQSYQQGDGTPTDLITIYFSGSCFKMVSGYTAPLKMTDFYFSGGASAIYGIPNGMMIMDQGVIQGAVGMNFDHPMSDIGPENFAFTNVTFLPYGHHPPRYIVAVHDTIWDGMGPFPLGGNVPPPPPPPPTPVWTTLTGTFQTLNTMPPQFRFCADPANESTCQAFVKS